MKHVHEWPLVIFSVFAIAGAGILAAWPLSLATRLAADPPENAIAAAAMLAAAMAVSVAHLGRKLRFPLAFRQSGRSPLSNEAVAAVLVFIAVLPLAIGIAPQGALWPRGLAAALASLFLVSLGLVYRLPVAPAWMGLASVGPLVGGLLFGSIWRLATLDAWGTRFAWPAFALTALDAAILLARAHAITRAAGEAAHPALFSRRHALLFARFLFLDAATALLLFNGQTAEAVVTAALGLLLDRVAFYGLAVTRTIESEIQRVEAVLAETTD
jgi:DMSO reductase anchor subunit